MFSLVNVSRDFTKVRMSEISLNGTVNDIWVDDNTIEKEDILNILEYLKE